MWFSGLAMPSVSTSAKKEVRELHDYIETLEKENRRWRFVSVGLGLLSVVISVLGQFNLL